MIYATGREMEGSGDKNGTMWVFFFHSFIFFMILTNSYVL